MDKIITVKEGEEVPKPEVGMLFDSLESMKAYLNKYMQQVQELFTINRSSLFSPSKEDRLKFKYKKVDYYCKYGGAKYRPMSNNIRESSTVKVGCPAFISICIAEIEKRKFLKIEKTDLTHKNHDGSKALFPYLSENRRLSTTQEKIAINHLELGCNKKLLQEKIHTEFKKPVSLKDLHNLRAKYRHTENSRKLPEAVKFLQSKGADVSIQIDKNQEFKALYFSTSDMKNSMRFWPEVVFLDGTYSLLDSNMTLMLLVVEDSNGSTNVAGAGLLAAENNSTMKWFIQKFKENNPEASKKIRCFMADKDKVERNALHEIFPNIPVYICLFHTLQAFQRALDKDSMHLSKVKKEDCIKIMKDLAYSCTEKKYLEIYKIFCESMPQKVVEYFNKNWHPLREEWCSYGMTASNLLNRTNNRLESMNQKIKQVIKNRKTLVEFLELFFTFLTSQTIEVNHRAAKNFIKKSTKYNKNTIEYNYMNLLTQKGFEMILEELKNYKTIAANMKLEKKNTYENYSVTSNNCDCNIFASSLLPCRHIFAVRNICNLSLFDEKLCDNRWTKAYYQQTQRLFNPQSVATKPLPLISEVETPTYETLKEKLDSLKPLAKSIIHVASNSCGLEFDNKVQILKDVLVYWTKNLDVHIMEKTKKPSTACSEKPLSTQIAQLEINPKYTGTKKKIITVPAKRKIVTPLTDQLIDIASSSISSSFIEKLNTLKSIMDFWNNCRNIEIKEKNNSNNFNGSKENNSSFTTSNCNLETILSPSLIKIKGHPSLGSITTPPVKYKKKINRGNKRN